MRRLVGLAAGLWLGWAMPAAAAVEVHARGAVTHAGTLLLKDSARLSDAALAAGVRSDAYLLGAAWLRPSRVQRQTALRAGIVYDFGALRMHALRSGDIDAARALRGLQHWLAGLPVTGRETAMLTPRMVEATPSANLPVAAGDTLFYPLRVDTVRVVGAVRQTCTLPLQPLQTAPHYLDRCAHAALADRDWAWVIQPDGHVFRQGIAAWNRSAPLPLAPGAVIYVPIRHALADSIDRDLNHEVAEFLATQPMPGPAP